MLAGEFKKLLEGVPDDMPICFSSNMHHYHIGIDPQYNFTKNNIRFLNIKLMGYMDREGIESRVEQTK